MTGGAREIALALGKARREGRAWRCCCPLHGGRSLVLRDLLLKCWGGNCATEDVLAELRRRGLIETRDQEQRPIQPSLSRPTNKDDHELRQHEKAAWLWSQRRPIKGTIAEKYLQGRGITCPLQSTLAFLRPAKPEHHPAMIAAFSLPDEIEPGLLGAPRNVEAVHLTLLRSDGNLRRSERSCAVMTTAILAVRSASRSQRRSRAQRRNYILRNAGADQTKIGAAFSRGNVT